MRRKFQQLERVLLYWRINQLSEMDLRNWLRGYSKLVILGIGNSMRGDDALGLEIVEQLKGKVPQNVVLFAGETTPERFSAKIARLKSTHVLLIDAAHFDAEPGETRLVPPSEIDGVALSTHTAPLYILAEVIEKRARAKVMLLGVQPKRVHFGEQMTPEAHKAAKKVAKIIVEILNKGK